MAALPPLSCLAGTALVALPGSFGRSLGDKISGGRLGGRGEETGVPGNQPPDLEQRVR